MLTFLKTLGCQIDDKHTRVCITTSFHVAIVVTTKKCRELTVRRLLYDLRNRVTESFCGPHEVFSCCEYCHTFRCI